MLTTLEQKVDPRNAALLVIDMQNDFCSPQGTSAVHGADLSLIRNMIPKLAKLIDEARKARTMIVFVYANYSSDQNWYLSEVYLEQMMRRRKGALADYSVCKQGTWGWELVDPIKQLPSEVTVNKHRWTAFFGTDLDIILRNRGIKSVILTGVTSNVCVESTARDAFFHDYYVVFSNDCTGSYSKESHMSTLKTIEASFGVVASSEEIIKCWMQSKLSESLGGKGEITLHHN